MFHNIRIIVGSLLTVCALYSCELIEISPQDLFDEALEEAIPLALGIDECETAQDTTTEVLPAAAVDYIDQSYPQDSIKKVFALDNGNFRVKLESSTVLVFDENGSVLGQGMPIQASENTATDSLLASLDSVSTTLEIDDVYLDFDANGDTIFVVEFDDDFAVTVDPQGNALCFEDDDDFWDGDDDDDDDED